VYAKSQDDVVAQKLLGKLGVEPLGNEFDVVQFRNALSKRKTAIKQVLLAGELVVGVGNIYASEALFLAGIRPTARADSLSRPKIVRLHKSVRDVLARAVEKGGSTLRDFSNAHGETGYFQLEAMVYGRSGEACKVCGTPIKVIRQGQRSTFFCPICQKP
jgi:formamidopyrimidine-DNA glycosylase